MCVRYYFLNWLCVDFFCLNTGTMRSLKEFLTTKMKPTDTFDNHVLDLLNKYITVCNRFGILFTRNETKIIFRDSLPIEWHETWERIWNEKVFLKDVHNICVMAVNEEYYSRGTEHQWVVPSVLQTRGNAYYRTGPTRGVPRAEVHYWACKVVKY